MRTLVRLDAAAGSPGRTLATGAIITALALGTGLMPAAPANAQRGEAPQVHTPVGRAPLTFADIVERVKPAVVSVHVSNDRGSPSQSSQQNQPRDRSPGGRILPDLPDDHPLNELFRNLPREFGGRPGGGRGFQLPRPAQAQGSGFVISADGYIVTNNHVIDGENRKISVSFDRDNRYDVTVVGTDPRTDIALLKITPKPEERGKTFPFVRFAAKDPRVGDWVVAVGNPFGLGGTVTAGIVSANGRDIGSGPYDFLQIDAAVNRGNSGGPTFNLDGEVIGVNTAIYSPSGGNVGIAFAVPARVAQDVVEKLRTHRSVARGWLGVKIENIDDDKAASLGLGQARGALINEVTENGPAAAAGLRAGDAVISIDGAPIRDSRELARKVAEFNPGTTVQVEVMRFGRREVIPVKLGTFPASGTQVARVEPPSRPAEGDQNTVTIADLGLSVRAARSATRNARDGDGVAITEVKEGSDAASKGLRVGDIILEVQGEKVATPAEVQAGVKRATEAGRKAVMLRVRSGDTVRFVAVQLKAG